MGYVFAALFIIFVFFLPSIFKYIKEKPLERLLILGAWGFSCLMTAICAFVVRAVLIVPESANSFFQAGGSFDKFLIFILFWFFLLLSYLLFFFYKKNTGSRFMLIFSFQVFIISVFHLLYFYISNNLNITNGLFYTGGIIFAIILFVFSRMTAEKSVKELLIYEFPKKVFDIFEKGI